ncbi:hypothetical protein ABL78_6283 [Leptomonas seymouri]|uniref:Leucine-rich repeat protein n=1 Tax=Leptomonas seymouri TaxID=5684 RepID=A0A0N0P4C3_LEPSE|nr:hypothetical protein ABL78_6283 [Leptomonas seymouri]|eukprot:KPI84667.1 hypothetical protein ABL78_6283 [Leptomonas seymouri]
MLFEPCGDLLKDYGAYCETLRVTEREEVYSAIHTCTVEVPRLSIPGEDCDAASARAEGEEGRGGAGSTSSFKPKSSRKASRVGAEDATSGRRKSSMLVASAAGGAGAVSSLAEATAVPPVVNATLTSIKLHYPVFCLNQRDMTPLGRAIPHCPSLLSIELVGCGLSVQSYMKLVDAIYRSPRVISVTVDFNVPFIEYHCQRRSTSLRDTVEAGFVIDPTLHPPNYTGSTTPDFLLGPLQQSDQTTDFRSLVSSTTSQDPGCNVSAATAQPRGSAASSSGHVAGTTNTASFAPGQQAHNGSTRKAGDAASKNLTPLDSRLSRISFADTAGAAGVDAFTQGLLRVAGARNSGLHEDENASTTLYLYPTQYCGLDQQPTPLELQIQEEKEKKGKADGKKVQQLQVQRDMLRTFDQQHRIPVPKAWDGILLTGIHHLSLRGNHIDDATAGRLAQVLMDHPQSRLVSLNLWGNEITDVGAAALARMLRVNNVLQVLDLGNNQLSDVGLLELVSVFLMQQLTSQEEIFAARNAYLTRRGASEAEQKAAGVPLVLADIPSYEDLYAHWWYTQQQMAQGLSPVVAGTSQTDAVKVGNSKASQSPTLAFVSLPAPPARDAQSSPTAAGNPKRTPPTKSKANKAESLASAATGTNSAAAPNATMSSSAARAANRHPTSFDRCCVRVRHIADNDPTIRIPGNMVLEVLNLEENRFITVAGAREAARLLQLREPVEAAEMLAMVEVRETQGLLSGHSSRPTSVSTTPNGAAHRQVTAMGLSSTTASANVSSSALLAAGATVVHAPELHCAGLRLRVCGVRSHHESNREAWSEIDAVQEELNAALAIWASSSPSA